MSLDSASVITPGLDRCGAQRHYRGVKRRACALAGVLGASGCFLFDDPDGEDPCDADRFGCADGQLDIDPSCELEGELVVAVGSGEGAFEPLAAGEQPPVFTGPQGGQHTLLGVRVENAALDRYDELQVELGIFSAAQCPAPEADDLQTPCTGDPPAGTRTVVLGDQVPLAVTDAGIVEEHDIVVFVAGLDQPDMVLQAIVVDPCGRHGIARHHM